MDSKLLDTQIREIKNLPKAGCFFQSLVLGIMEIAPQTNTEQLETFIQSLKDNHEMADNFDWNNGWFRVSYDSGALTSDTFTNSFNEAGIPISCTGIGRTLNSELLEYIVNEENGYLLLSLNLYAAVEYPKISHLTGKPAIFLSDQPEGHTILVSKHQIFDSNKPYGSVLTRDMIPTLFSNEYNDYVNNHPKYGTLKCTISKQPSFLLTNSI